MSSAEGAFVGSPQGARVAKAPPSFGLVPITSRPQSLWASHLLSFGGPGLDLYVRASWDAVTGAPEIFDLNTGGDGPTASFPPGATAHPCGIADAGWRTSFGVDQPRRSASMSGAAVEIASSEAGPWYALGTDHASSFGNPWGLFLAAGSISGSTPTTFGNWAFTAGRSHEQPIGVVWLTETELPYTPITQARYTNIVGANCATAPDSIYSDYLLSWSWGLTLLFRRRNSAAVENGQQYRVAALESWSLDALTIGRNAAFYAPVFDAIGMNLSKRPPHIHHAEISGRVRVYLGAGPTS